MCLSPVKLHWSLLHATFCYPGGSASYSHMCTVHEEENKELHKLVCSSTCTWLFDNYICIMFHRMWEKHYCQHWFQHCGNDQSQSCGVCWAVGGGSVTLLKLSLFLSCFFLQLRDTKSIGQDTTLLHFLASKCEENHEAMLRFPEELEHVESASKGRMPSSRKPHCKPVHFTQYAPHVSSLLRRWVYVLHLCSSTFCLCAPTPTPRLPLPLWQDCKGPASLSFGPSIN